MERQLHRLHDRLDENGIPISPPSSLGVIGTPGSLVSNGMNYLLLTDGRAQLLDREGKLLRRVEPGFVNVRWAGVMGNRYHVLHSEATAIRLSEVRDDGSVSTTDVRPIEFSAQQSATAAASDDRILVVHSWRHEYRIGNQEWRSLPAELRGGIRGAAWDGSTFLVMSSSDSALLGVRIAPDGTLIDSTPFVIASGAAGTASVASNGERHLVVWTESGDVHARSVSSFAELAAETAAWVTLSLTPSEKTTPQIARAGANELVTWIDHATRTIEGSVNGHLFAITPLTRLYGEPAISGGEREFAIAWIEEDTDRMSVFMTRVQFDGTVETRRLVEMYAKDKWMDLKPALAWGGGSYHLVFTRAETLQVYSMDSAGNVSFAKSIDEESPNLILRPRAVWNGSELVIAYFLQCCAHWPETATTTLRLRRLSADEPGVLPHVIGVYDDSLGFAAGADRLTLAFRAPHPTIVQRALDTSEIRGVAPVILPHIYPATGEPLVWNGSEYVLVWSEWVNPLGGEVVRAFRIDANGRPIDAVPIDIALAHSPHAAASPEGMRIVYLRKDRDNHDTTRVYARTLERFTAAPRRRAVGR